MAATVLESIRALQRRKGPKCSACLTIKGLTGDVRKGVIEALNDETISTNAVSEYLQGLGHRVPAHTLRRHARGDCSRA